MLLPVITTSELKLWDIAGKHKHNTLDLSGFNSQPLCVGQDPFRKLMPLYARHSVVALVMCNVMERETMYRGAQIWKNSVDTSVYLPNGQPIPCILLVNKVGGLLSCGHGWQYHTLMFPMILCFGNVNHNFWMIANISWACSVVSSNWYGCVHKRWSCLFCVCPG